MDNNNTSLTFSTGSISSNPANLRKLYKTLEYVQDIYILPIVCVVGIIGNSLVASVLYRRRGSNSSFLYMFAIVFFDILSLVSDISLPIATLLGKTNSLFVKDVSAKLYFWSKVFVSYILRGTAFNTLCVLSVERFIAIRYPLKLKSSLTVKRPIIFLICSFMLSVCVTLPTVVVSGIDSVYDDKTNATIFKRVYLDVYYKDQRLSDLILLIAHFIAGPVQIVFFLVMNVLIINGIHENRKNLLAMKASNADRLKTIKHVQVKLCKIFLILCLTNVLAFLPNSVIAIISKLFPELGFSVKNYTTLILLHGGNFLRVLNSASDFVVMLVMSQEIRRDLKKTMCGQLYIKYLEDDSSPRSQNIFHSKNSGQLNTCLPKERT